MVSLVSARIEFIAANAINSSVIIIIYLCTCLHASQRQSYHEWRFLTYIGCATLWFLFLAYLMRYSRSPMVRRFAWGTSGGSLAGFQNFLKDSLTVLKATSHPGSTESVPTGLFVGLIGLAAFAAFAGLLLLTACMKRYDATYSSAMFVGSFVISASVMSVIHYDTINHLDDTVDLILYPTGLVILMAGVSLLLTTSTDRYAPAAEDEDDDETAGSRSEPTIIMMVCLKYT